MCVYVYICKPESSTPHLHLHTHITYLYMFMWIVNMSWTFNVHTDSKHEKLWRKHKILHVMHSLSILKPNQCNESLRERYRSVSYCIHTNAHSQTHKRALSLYLIQTHTDRQTAREYAYFGFGDTERLSIEWSVCRDENQCFNTVHRENM